MEFMNMSRCPICRSGDVRQIFQPDSRAFDRFLDLSRKKYAGVMDGWVEFISLGVLSCRNCLHVWHREFPGMAELSIMYGSSKAIDSARRLTAPNQRMLSEMALLRQMTAVGSGRSKPRLLDYGSGFGLWARAAVSAGFEVVAFEPSSERAESRDSDGSFRCVNDVASLHGERFDAINCEQVLEHVGDPGAVLQTFRNLSSPGALIRITVPNSIALLRSRRELESFPFDGQRPHMLSPYEHLHGFTPRSFDWLIRSAGLRKSHSVVYRAPKQWLRMMVPNTFFLGRFGD